MPTRMRIWVAFRNQYGQEEVTSFFVCESLEETPNSRLLSSEFRVRQV